MSKKLFLPLIVSAILLIAEQSYTDQYKQFQQYKQSQEAGFKRYQEAEQKAFEDYKKELGIFWDTPKLSNKTEWVTYTKDKKTRTDIDFKNETIEIETLAASETEAKNKINLALAKAVTIDTKKAYELDPLQNRLHRISKPRDLVSAQPDAKPILKNIVFRKPPTEKDIVDYVQKNTTKIKTRTSQKQKKIYFVQVKLPKDTTYKRSTIYFEDVLQNSKKQEIPLPLVFAIMHSESSFNPMARSHIPAYGLMQIVPRTAGIDAYNYLYNQKRLVSGSYLYNSSNNIKMGTAYLHILYYNYLRHIKNPQSRLYCTIAAYNTGAGNVARAFVRSNSVPSAARVINRLSPDEVYRKLLRDLKHNEPKHYLQRVTKRMKVYKEVYKNS